MPLYSISSHPTWSYTEEEHQQMLALDAAKEHLKLRLEQIRRQYSVEPYRYNDLEPHTKGWIQGYEAAYSAIQHLAGETGFAFYRAARRRAEGS